MRQAGKTSFGSIFVSVRRVIDRISLHLVRLFGFYVLEFDHVPVLPAAARLFGFTVASGTKENITALLSCWPQLSIVELEARFSCGDHCALVRFKDQVVGYEWACLDSVHVEARYHVALPIPSDAIYLYDCFVQPEYRKRGVWLVLRAYWAEFMKQASRSRVFSIVDIGNDLSLNTHLHFGYKVVSWAVGFQMCGKTLSKTTKLILPSLVRQNRAAFSATAPKRG